MMKQCISTLYFILDTLQVCESPPPPYDPPPSYGLALILGSQRPEAGLGGCVVSEPVLV